MNHHSLKLAQSVVFKFIRCYRGGKDGLVAQDQVDHRIHVGDVHLTVTVHVADQALAGAQNHVDECVDVGNVHLAVAVHVTGQAGLYVVTSSLPSLSVPYSTFMLCTRVPPSLTAPSSSGTIQ